MVEERYPEDYKNPCDSDKDYTQNYTKNYTKDYVKNCTKDYSKDCDKDYSKDCDKDHNHCTNPECGKIKIWAECVEIDIDCFR